MRPYIRPYMTPYIWLYKASHARPYIRPYRAWQGLVRHCQALRGPSDRSMGSRSRALNASDPGVHNPAGSKGVFTGVRASQLARAIRGTS